MKVVIALLSIVALVGIAYGLAFAGIIPVAKLAGKNTQIHKALIAMKLEKPAPKATVTMRATAAPVVDPLAADRAALQAERAQVAQEKAVLDRKLATPIQPVHPANWIPPTSDKVAAIYATMKPSEIAAVFEKLSDAQVCDALLKMDESKAGKVLVAMPPARAAILTTRMNQATAPTQSGAESQAIPVASVP